MTNAGELIGVALLFLIVGVVLCICGVAVWYMLRMIKALQASVDALTRATGDLLAEGSFTRMSKQLQTLTGAIPDIIGGINEFARVMRMVFRSNEEGDESASSSRSPHPQGPAPQAGEESAFYPGKSEQELAQQEITEEARRQRLVLDKVDLAGMHTDEAT